MPADHILKDMIRLLKLPHVIAFIIFLFMLGNCWGFIESYLFLYLKELGAPNYLLGKYYKIKIKLIIYILSITKTNS